ncbi:MAG: dihydroneopterin aldolase [Candidatus Caenarcaniphilales bacterium]|nr:dihydroneopterin aldolase [Candidatus Caenarcaniphilales bacterium]
MSEIKKDYINVQDINCFTKIGVADNERAIGQSLKIDLEVYIDLVKAGESDNLIDTVSYIELVNTVDAVSQEKDYKLLEHFASKISESIFTKFSLVNALGVRVHKPHIPNPSFKGRSSVYIYRER